MVTSRGAAPTVFQSASFHKRSSDSVPHSRTEFKNYCCFVLERNNLVPVTVLNRQPHKQHRSRKIYCTKKTTTTVTRDLLCDPSKHEEAREETSTHPYHTYVAISRRDCSESSLCVVITPVSYVEELLELYHLHHEIMVRLQRELFHADPRTGLRQHLVHLGKGLRRRARA